MIELYTCPVCKGVQRILVDSTKESNVAMNAPIRCYFFA